MRILQLCLLMSLPLVSVGFLATTPASLLQHAPSLRGSSRATIASLSMQQQDEPGVSRRKSLGLLSLLPLAGLALAAGEPKPASAKLLGVEEMMINVFDQSLPSVCYISTDYTSIGLANNVDATKLPKGVGSGFVWDKEGHIVTNFHVINKVDKATVIFSDADGNKKTYEAKLTGVDPDKDIAVLKITAPKDELKPLSMGTNSNLKIGQFAMAIGNPFGQDTSLSTGVISGKNRMITAPTGRKINGVIQTDAAINPGNSGGPLLDSEGKLIGINTASLGAGVSAGVGFAVPIDTAKGVIEQLVQFGQVQRAVLGISYLERLPTEAEAAKSGIPRVKEGAVVLEVPAGSPCAAAGMVGVTRKGQGQPTELGDVIVAINDAKVVGPGDLGKAMEAFKPNDQVKITVLRGNEAKKVVLPVTLGAFRGSAFSKMESERPDVATVGAMAPLNVPLSDIAPQLTPGTATPNLPGQ